MDQPVTVTTITQTCLACPSQWEGTADDGRVVYIRYRWGSLSIGVGRTLQEAVNADRWTLDYGDPIDGFLAYDELKTLIPGWLRLPEYCADNMA
jgi:hypothetical protein